NGSHRKRSDTTAKPCIAPIRGRRRGDCLHWKATNGTRRKGESFSCRRFRRSTTGLPVGGRRSVESRAYLCPTPAGCPAGVSLPPVVRNCIACAGEPFLVATELIQ